MNLPMNNIKMRKINNLYIKQIKLCPQLLKKYCRILDGLSGMKKFMMKINGIFIGKILGKIFYFYQYYLNRPSLGEFKRSKAY